MLRGARVAYTLPAAATNPQPALYMGQDFLARDSTILKTYLSNGGVYVNGVLGRLVARTDPPQGSRIVGVTYYAIDNNPGASASMIVGVITPDIQDFNVATLSSTIGAEAVIRAFTLPAPLFTADNAQSSYQLAWSPGVLGDTMVLYAVRVDYLLPTNQLPQVFRSHSAG